MLITDLCHLESKPDNPWGKKRQSQSWHKHWTMGNRLKIYLEYHYNLEARHPDIGFACIGILPDNPVFDLWWHEDFSSCSNGSRWGCIFFFLLPFPGNIKLPLDVFHYLVCIIPSILQILGALSKTQNNQPISVIFFPSELNSKQSLNKFFF